MKLLTPALQEDLTQKSTTVISPKTRPKKPQNKSPIPKAPVDPTQQLIDKTRVKISDLQTLVLDKESTIDFNSEIFPRYLLGKNQEINWKIYKASGQTDTLFHLDKFPSPYVIINSPIESLSKEQLYLGALLCKSKSKFKNVPNIGIFYTPISNTILGEKVGSFMINSNHKKYLIHI